MNRKVFDKLHEELSLEHSKLYPRYALWVSVREYGYDADNLQPSEAANWCRAYGHITIASKMAKFNPNAQRPEEVLARICGD